MQKLLIVFVPIILVFGILGWYFLNNDNQPQQQPQKGQTPEISIEQAQQPPTDFTAEFDIYTNGTKRIFTDTRYHNQSNKVYIEEQNPNTVNVKASNLTWADFFETLPMELTKDCLVTGTNQTFCTNQNQTLRFYLNDTKNPDALEREIEPNDYLKVIYD